MTVNCLRCDAVRPDRRALAKMFEEIAGADAGLAREYTDILLDGSPVEIDLSSKTTSSAFRALRKNQVEYEIVE